MSTTTKLCEALKRACDSETGAIEVSFRHIANKKQDYWRHELHSSARGLKSCFFSTSDCDYPILKFSDGVCDYRVLFQANNQRSFVVVKEAHGATYTLSDGPTLHEFSTACDHVITDANKERQQTPMVSDVFDLLPKLFTPKPGVPTHTSPVL